MTDIANDPERLTLIYRRIRAAREKNTAEYNQRDAELKAQQAEVARLLLQCLGNNTSLGNKHGTVRKTIKQKFWSTDWENMRKFCIENNAVDLFENRIAQRNMAEWVVKYPDKIPPGLQIDRRYDVQVTKPRSKPDDVPTGEDE